MRHTGKHYREMTAKELAVVELKVVTGIAIGCVAVACASTMLRIDNATQPVSEQEPQVIVTTTVAHKDDAITLSDADPVVHVVAQPATTMTKWADCRVTAYCPCEKCCGKYARNRPIDPVTGLPIVYGASGKQLESKVTCASSLPFGTKLYIPDLDLYTTVEDRAAKSIDSKYSGHYVDIYIPKHKECFEYLSGKPEYMEVYIVE